MIEEREEEKLEFLKQRQRAYRLTFSSPAGQDALLDLVKFCRANETCVVPGDHDRTLLLEGRREVWLRIVQHMNLNISQLFALYNGRQFGLVATGGEDDDDQG